VGHQYLSNKEVPKSVSALAQQHHEHDEQARNVECKGH